MLSENPQLATPLTKRRKSEGRGNSFTPEFRKAPQPPKLCRICGTPVTKANHCPSCVSIAAREQMANVALTGHMKPRSAASQRRAEKKLSDHAVANTWFDPGSLPSWRDTGLNWHKLLVSRDRLWRFHQQSIGVSVRCGRGSLLNFFLKASRRQ